MNSASYNNLTWKQYIEATILYNTQQIYKQAVYDLQQQKELKIDSDEFKKIIQRQDNQKLNINGDKISGAVDLNLIGLNNQAKAEGIYSFDDEAKVKFIAVEDEVTTQMCRSLDGQEFYVHDWNNFKRYSKTNDSVIECKCYGLVVGLNCPPVTDGFHFCRSTIEYLVNDNEDKPTYLRKIKNIVTEDDYKELLRQYRQVPIEVRMALFNKKQVKIKYNPQANTSTYNPKTNSIVIAPNVQDGELVHEIGHAIYYNFDLKNTPKYKDICNKIFNNSNGVKYENIEGRNMYYLDTKFNVPSKFSVYLGERDEDTARHIYKNELIELPSVIYERYRGTRKKLDKELIELVEYMEELCKKTI